MSFSASSAVALYRRQDAFAYVRPQLLYAAMGLGAMWMASRVDYHIYHKLAWPLLTLSLVLLTAAAGPVLEAVGIPRETAGLVLVRPLSGSGALAVGSELMARYGTESYIGRCAAVMLGCTETTFYTVAVYFGAAGIRRTRYAIPAALCADAVGFLAAAWTVRWLM